MIRGYPRRSVLREKQLESRQLEGNKGYEIFPKACGFQTLFTATGRAGTVDQCGGFSQGGYGSDCFFAALIVANADRVIDPADKDLAVADAAGPRRTQNGIHDFVL